MIRVLHIVSKMDIGGIENYLMNLYRNIDRDKIQFDFVVTSDGIGYYDKEINDLGGKIYNITKKKDSVQKNFIQLFKLVKKNKYEIVHRHGSNGHMSLDLLAAKLAGAKTRIAHSHSNRPTGNFIAHKVFKNLTNFVSTHRFAASESAGEHLFGNRKFKVIENGINIKKFEYNDENRKKIRKSYNIEDDCLVIGNVGRLDKVKNHEFLVEVFYELNKINKNSLLMIIGEGNSEEDIRTKIDQLNLQSKVLLLGKKDNISDYMQVFDVFVLPSINEGLGIVLLEAQASGLLSFTSKDVVPKESQVTDLLSYISLLESPNEWAKIILEKTSKKIKRFNYNRALYNTNVDVLKSSEKMMFFYIENFSKGKEENYEK